MAHPGTNKQSMFGGFVKGKDGDDDEDMAYKAGYGAGMAKAGYGEGYKEGMDKGGYEKGYKEGMTKALSKSDSESVTEDELIKSLEQLEDVAHTVPLNRKEELLAKSENGGLSDAESVELVDILNGGGGLSGEIQKSMQPSDNMEKSMINVSDFLREIYEGTTDSLAKIGDRMEKSFAHQGDYNAALADGIVTLGRTVVEQGELIKSLSGMVEEMSGQPARAPKAQRSGAQPLAKSLGQPQVPAGPEGQDNMSKAQVLDTLEEMMMKSDQGQYGAGNGHSKGGENIHEAIAKYEAENKITAGLAQEVLAFRQSRLN